MNEIILPPVWVIVKDGRVICTNDEPCVLDDIVGVEYRPTGPDQWPKDCGLSWSGNRISGDRASIDAIQRIIMIASTVEALTERIRELEASGKVTTKEVRESLVRAYDLGKEYWRLADSESPKQHRRAEEIQAKFDSMLEKGITHE